MGTIPEGMDIMGEVEDSVEVAGVGGGGRSWTWLVGMDEIGRVCSVVWLDRLRADGVSSDFRIGRIMSYEICFTSMMTSVRLHDLTIFVAKYL